jgi:hypothetical protein
MLLEPPGDVSCRIRPLGCHMLADVVGAVLATLPYVQIGVNSQLEKAGVADDYSNKSATIVKPLP